MDKKEILEKVIFPTIDKANEVMPGFFIDKKNENIVLYGADNAILDSLNLVSFVFMLEEEIENTLGKSIKITTDDVLNTSKPPFISFNNLSEFLIQKIDQC